MLIKNTSIRVCLTPRVHGVGGMVSFRRKLTAGLEAMGVEVTNNLSDFPYNAVLVIGGTRNLAGLLRARNKGIPIVQRLNGMNWLHRKLRTGPRHYLRAEMGNILLKIIRQQIASRVVYQSEFARHWWEREHGPTSIPSEVIYNGVDLNIYNPEGKHHQPDDRFRLLLVEGSLGGGYELGLETAIHLTEMLVNNHQLPMELMVVGSVSDQLQNTWKQRTNVSIQWAGLVPTEIIPEIDRSAHLLYAADLNAACPNATIEALACGLPVVAFDTGALPELVTSDAGGIVPYGGDPWELDPPDIPALAQSAARILKDGGLFRKGARARAEGVFGLQTMVEKYLSAMVPNRLV